MYQNFFKRLIDVVLSFLGAIILLPVFLIVALAIVIDDPGPVFFKQKRVGKNKKLFWLHKFRSMKVKTPDIPTHLLTNPQQYITKVGKFLQAFLFTSVKKSNINFIIIHYFFHFCKRFSINLKK